MLDLSPTSAMVTAGACGNKCLMVVQGRADVALMNLQCSLWDTCATVLLTTTTTTTATSTRGRPPPPSTSRRRWWWQRGAG